MCLHTVHERFTKTCSLYQIDAHILNIIISDGSKASFSTQTTDLLTQAMTELSQTLTTDYRTVQGDFQRIQYIPVSQAGGGLAQPQHIQLQVVQVAPVRAQPFSQDEQVIYIHKNGIDH